MPSECPIGVKGTLVPEPSSAAFQGACEQEAGLEVEELGLEPGTWIWMRCPRQQLNCYATRPRSVFVLNISV